LEPPDHTQPVLASSPLDPGNERWPISPPLAPLIAQLAPSCTYQISKAHLCPLWALRWCWRLAAGPAGLVTPAPAHACQPLGAKPAPWFRFWAGLGYAWDQGILF
jgi:hypothetical protein